MRWSECDLAGFIYRSRCLDTGDSHLIAHLILGLLNMSDHNAINIHTVVKHEMYGSYCLMTLVIYNIKHKLTYLCVALVSKAFTIL